MEIRKVPLTCCQKVLPLVFCKVKLLYNGQFHSLHSNQPRWYGGGRHCFGLQYLSEIPETLRLVLMLL